MRKYNTFGKRLLALIIDSIILIPFSYLHSYMPVNRFSFITTGLIDLFAWATYTITLHSYFGQTVGKFIAGIKVYTLSEDKTLTLKKSFLRESLLIIGQFVILLYFFYKVYASSTPQKNIIEYQTNLAVSLTVLWYILELISMLTNPKRRSIQDFIAGSVVITT